MVRVGGLWWVEDPQGEGERSVAHWPANRKQGRLVRGGALFLTDVRLAFRPHDLERRLGGRAWEADLGEVVAVDVARRTGRLRDGGLVDRLRVRLGSGAVELFVVREPARVAAVVRGAAGVGERSGPDRVIPLRPVADRRRGRRGDL